MSARRTCTGINFNPRSPDGERRRQIFTVPKSQRFQSTLPGWGATLSLSISARCSRIFQSTLPGWGATIANDFPTLETNFNPRSPDGERQGAQDGANWIDAFQSTLPGWGATVISMFFGIIITIFQSTLPGWGATCYAVACNRSIEFQSTLPGWGATVAFDLGEVLAVFISIHAPRMGSDNDNNVLTPDFKISIHAPRMGSDHGRFMGHAPLVGISIHAPRMGSDRFAPSAPPPTAYFNPRSPDGERPVIGVRPQHFDISIHAPRMGSDVTT